MSTAAVQDHQSAPMDPHSDVTTTGAQPQAGSSLAAMQLEALGDNEDMGSDDAVADEDNEMEGEDEPPKNADAPSPPSARNARRPGLRARVNLKNEMRDEDMESEDDEDGMNRNEEDYTESGTEGEDELDSDEERKRQERKAALPPAAKRSIKTVRDLPTYAQHAYLASTYGLPSKLPVPMVLLPGLRSRKAPPVPVYDLTKRSRGRHVSKDFDEQKRYICSVDGCDKRFARGEHLKRHIRSIHTHEKPHQCPYPGCTREFSRTDNMMQHMRTHDDWPDDEAAAKINAEIEKRGTKKASSSSGGRKASAQVTAPVPSIPWGMFPPLMNWAPQQKSGTNPLVPMPFPMLPFPPQLPLQMNANMSKETSPGPKTGDVNDPASNGTSQIDQFLASFTLPNGSSDQKASPLSASVSSPAIPPGLLTMPPMPFQFPIPPLAGPSSPKSTSKRLRHTRNSSRADTILSASTEASIPPSTPGAATSISPIELTTSPSAASPSTSQVPPSASQPLPPSMPLPFMPMGSQMQMPGGIPWPPPAIAVPIPAGAPLPPLSQLPPNAQLVPDGKGGHTIIIPPPPLPWGMPFPTGSMPSPIPLPTPQAVLPSTDASTNDKVPISTE